MTTGPGKYNIFKSTFEKKKSLDLGHKISMIVT